MTDLSTMAEPYKIKMVESIRMTTRQEREVELVDYAGSREVYGFRAAIMGPLEAKP